MLSLVRSKVSTPGLLLAIAVALAFLISALVNRDVDTSTDLPGVDSAAVKLGE